MMQKVERIKAKRMRERTEEDESSLKVEKSTEEQRASGTL